MATKTIKALVNGVIQEIEVEDITVVDDLSYDDRLEALEDKPIITDGNFLVGNGTEDLEEISPEEVLSHINGASVATMTTSEFEALEDGDINANTLYMLTDVEEGGALVINGVVYDGSTSIDITDIINDMIDAKVGVIPDNLSLLTE